MKYNILFISHERKMGGANHSLLELVEGLRKLGNNVSVAVLYRGCPIDRKLRERGFRTVPCIFGWWQQPEDWPVLMKAMFRLLHWTQKITVRRIVRYVKREHIDIIHSNTSVIDIGAQAVALAGCRHVWHFREYGEEDYRLEYMYGKQKSMDYVCNNSDMILFISHALYESYRKFADIDKSRVIYDGIVSTAVDKQTDRLQIKKKNKQNSVYTFLVTGNISPGKNQRLVVEAAYILTNCMGVDQKQFRIYFVGAVTALAESRKYMREVQNYITQNRLHNLIFKGYVEDMPSLRLEVDAEVIPSVSEAYGRVTLEAMLNRNLVIASDSGANPELIGDNRHGVLFRSNDAADLAQKMLDAMNGSNKKCIDDAYDYVVKVHKQESSYRKVHDIYEYITGKKQELQ